MFMMSKCIIPFAKLVLSICGCQRVKHIIKKKENWNNTHTVFMSLNDNPFEIQKAKHVRSAYSTLFDRSGECKIATITREINRPTITAAV